MSVKGIKKISPQRLSNPIPFEQRIFKCKRCSDHKYLTEESTDGVCKECAKAKKLGPTKNIGSDQDKVDEVDQGTVVGVPAALDTFDPDSCDWDDTDPSLR